jgi:hypothetical protein
MKQVRATSSYFRVCLINVAAQPESGIHVTLDPTDHGHDPGQIGLSEFRLDPLAEVKKVKTPLVAIFLVQSPFQTQGAWSVECLCETIIQA